jgi:beta-fructofuranosidase
MPATANGLDVPGCVLHNNHMHSPLNNDDGGGTPQGNGRGDLPPELLFKPSFHVTAPSGWLNDPCGPGYDPATGLYHLFFQWNPHGNTWGNMSWGHATSSDFVSWKTDPRPALMPTTEYDCCGVFTGCFRATDIHGKPGALTVIYTSVKCLPIHYTLPYVIGSESLSLAVSSDGGKTWERQECNPIIPGPPQNLSVTGWRDPSLTIWIRGQQSVSRNTQSDLCGLISGGIVSQTPTVFIYTVNSADLREWHYEGPLVDVGLNFHPSRWSGDFGINWEVANLMTLTNEFGDSRDFVIMKVEGGLHSEGCSQARQRRSARSQLWMSIKPSTQRYTSEDALATYAFAGIFDHGCFYAANSFWDPQTSQHILYGWITEEDLSKASRHRQGWSGMVSLPRAVRLITLRNVKKARTSPLQSITSIEMVTDASNGDTFTIHTLGIYPDRRLSRLRPRDSHQSLLLPLPLTASSDHCFPLTSAHWELQTEFVVSQSCERVGIRIAHSPGECYPATLVFFCVY